MVEDPSAVWQELEDLQQQRNEDVAAFVQRFENLWKRWCLDLGDEQPPLMIKKNMFIDGLVTGLKAKVDLKQPSNFEDAVLLAKEKEWKILRQKELGIMVDDAYLQRYVCEEPYAWTMGMYYTPPIFEKPKAACAVQIEEMIESPKKESTPCVALIKDVVKTKVDQMLTNKMKPPKKSGRFCEMLRRWLLMRRRKSRWWSL